MYELALRHYALAIGVALSLGAVLGAAGGLLLEPTPRASLLVLALALLGGAGAGRAIAWAMGRATRWKRGRAMQLVALLALIAAALVRLLVTDQIDLVTRDLSGMIAVGAGAVVAWERLR